MKSKPRDQANKLCTSFELQCPGALFSWDDEWNDDIYDDYILLNTDYDTDDE
jgi:hypothetical protein